MAQASMRTIRLTIAYDGTKYCGWQIQLDVPTIQGEIERHLATIHKGPVTLHGAGRTDAGVHARAMVAHFHTEKKLPAGDFTKALNAMLPDDIRIIVAEDAPSDFHARFSALGKTYRYSIFNGLLLLPQYRHFTVHIPQPLNIPPMQTCLNMLEGTHDFASFETAGSRDPDNDSGRGAVRTLFGAELRNEGNGFHAFQITGDGFLRHMVRNIAGTVLEVGLGRRSIESFNEAFLAKCRSEAGATAPAKGLTLERIYYNRGEFPISCTKPADVNTSKGELS